MGPGHTLKVSKGKESRGASRRLALLGAEGVPFRGHCQQWGHSRLGEEEVGFGHVLCLRLWEAQFGALC